MIGRIAGVSLCALVGVSCGDGSPTAPATDVRVPATAGSTDEGAVTALNQRPALLLKTTPRSVPGDPYPVISGQAPFTVKFNLCESSDPDQVILEDGTQDPSGDSLNWQFHFGDDGSAPFRADGTFNPHFEHFCRTEHTFTRSGTYVVTATVTDKHLEDQSHDVVASARETVRVTIEVGNAGFGTFTGELTTSDRLYDPPDVEGVPPPSCFTVGASVFYYDTLVILHAGGPMDIEVVAAGFDTWINLYSPDFDPSDGCKNLVGSDDDGGAGLLSRITGTFGPGSYVLVVTSFGGFATGPYTVEVRR